MNKANGFVSILYDFEFTKVIMGSEVSLGACRSDSRSSGSIIRVIQRPSCSCPSRVFGSQSGTVPAARIVSKVCITKFMGVTPLWQCSPSNSCCIYLFCCDCKSTNTSRILSPNLRNINTMHHGLHSSCELASALSFTISVLYIC